MIIAGWILTPEILKAGLGEATQISHSLTIAAAVYPLEGKCVAVKKNTSKDPLNIMIDCVGFLFLV